MKYKTKKGIVLTSVCGQYILVAAKKARDDCPYITKINETAAFCWRLLEEGCTADNLAQYMMEEYDSSDFDQIKQDILVLLEQLLEGGYITKTDERRG